MSQIIINGTTQQFWNGSPTISFTHSVSTDPNGVLVFLTNTVTGFDRVESVSYGSSEMIFVTSSVDDAGEEMFSQVWFLGEGIPQGNQTLSITYTGPDSDEHVINVISFHNLSNLDTQIVNVGIIGGDQQDPQITLETGGLECMAFGQIGSGHSSVSSLEMLSGMVQVNSYDYGANVVRFDRQENSDISDFTIGYTSPVEDAAYVAVNVSSIQITSTTTTEEETTSTTTEEETTSTTTEEETTSTTTEEPTTTTTSTTTEEETTSTTTEEETTSTTTEEETTSTTTEEPTTTTTTEEPTTTTTSTTTEEETTSTTTEEETTSTTTEEETTSTTTEEETTSTTTEEETTSTTTEEETTSTTTEESTTTTTSTTTEEETTSTTTEEPTTTTTSTTTEEETTSTTTEEPTTTTTSTTTEEETTSTTTEEETTSTTTEEETTSTTTEEETTSTTTEESTTTTTSTTTEEETTSTTTEEPTTTTTSTTTEEETTSTTTEEPSTTTTTTSTTTEEVTTSTTTEEETTSTTTTEPSGCIYYFSDLGSSNEISDGGDDMYDDANLLYANGQQISYTHTQLDTDDEEEQLYSNFIYDGVVFTGASSSYFGPSSSYFTNLYPGLFVLASRGVNIGTFSIDGNIGADGSGEVDNYNFQVNHSSGIHQTFVKRVWDAGDPSINHMIIVNAATASTLLQTVPLSTNDDTHVVSGLESQSVSNIYYLLSAKRDGVKITNNEISQMVGSFLNISASSSSISDLLSNLNTRFTEITGILNSDCHEPEPPTTTTSTTTETPPTTTTTSTTTEEETTSTTTEQGTTSTTTTSTSTTSTTTITPTTSTTTIPDVDIILYFDSEDEILVNEAYELPVKISYPGGTPLTVGAFSIKVVFDSTIECLGVTDVFTQTNVTTNCSSDNETGDNIFIFSVYSISGYQIPEGNIIFKIILDPSELGNFEISFDPENELAGTDDTPFSIYQIPTTLNVVSQLSTTTTSTTIPITTSTTTTISTSTTTLSPSTSTTTLSPPTPTTTTSTTTTPVVPTTTQSVLIPEVSGANTGSSSKFSSVATSKPRLRVTTPQRRRSGRFNR